MKAKALTEVKNTLLGKGIIYAPSIQDRKQKSIVETGWNYNENKPKNKSNNSDGILNQENLVRGKCQQYRGQLAKVSCSYALRSST